MQNYTATAMNTGTFFGTGGVTINQTLPFYPGGPQNFFSTQFSGKINIGTPGNYTFYSSSDDGSRLFIDGVLAANSDGAKGVTEAGGISILLSSGLHDITIDYDQGTGGDAEIASYQGPGIAKQIIPSTVISTPENVSAGTSVTVNATTTIGSQIIDVPSTAGLVPGEAITGAGIPIGAFIASIQNGNTLTLWAENTGSSALSPSPQA